MGLLNIFGTSPVEAVGNVLDKLFTSDSEKLSAQELIERLRQNPQEWVFELNKINANDNRLFNSGWRPFIGWVCGICVAIYYIPQFILAAYLWLTLCVDRGFIVPYPIDPTSLMELVYLILGFGAYRSIEKLTGTNKR
jgi:Holin of 3TMs, for gene-transfer release